MSDRAWRDLAGSASISIAVLDAALAAVSFACARDEQSSLSGILLSVSPDGTVSTIATDGMRLASTEAMALSVTGDGVLGVLPSGFRGDVLGPMGADGDQVELAVRPGDGGDELLIRTPGGATVAQPLWSADSHFAVQAEFADAASDTSVVVPAAEFEQRQRSLPAGSHVTLAVAPGRLLVRSQTGLVGTPIAVAMSGSPTQASFVATLLKQGWRFVRAAEKGYSHVLMEVRGGGAVLKCYGVEPRSGRRDAVFGSADYYLRSDGTTAVPRPWPGSADAAPPGAAHVIGADAASAPEDVEAILAELDAITGQPEVKEQVRRLVAQVGLNKKRMAQGLRGAQTAIHMVFTGPPGTGKTTVARLVARLLHALEVLPSSVVNEVDRSSLVAAHIGGTEEKTAAAIQDALGGVLFIDEAYALASGGENDFGTQAIEVLLKALEDRRGELVCIAAGYTKQMAEFLDANPGLRSRFTRTITFTPYTADELVDIAQQMAVGNDNVIDDAALGTLRLRLGDEERRGGFAQPSWGNARAVRNLLEAAATHRDLRIADAGVDDYESLVTITEDDMARACDDARIGRTVGVGETVADVLAELDRQVGQQQLRQQIEVLVAGATAARLRAEQGLGPSAPDLPHLLFSGPPGTGKTTIARLVARLYRALGLLSSGHVVEVDRGGLVASYIGGTAEKTTARIDEAMGGVLFIDEAYTLAQGGENDFGREAINTLLKRMSDDQGRFLVIAAGYGSAMTDFLAANVGLSRRFPTKIEFASYTAEELTQIAELMVDSSGERLADDARMLLAARLRAARDAGVFAKPDWGNAGSVGNIIAQAARVRNARLFARGAATPTPDQLVTLTAVDITVACDSVLGDPGATQERVEDVVAELEAQIGQPALKRQVATLLAGVRAQQAREAAGIGSGGTLVEHLVFTGPPGTGKTTVARLLARLYKALGVLPSGHVIEVDRAALVAGYVGQTATKTEERITAAMGGVLFIDEAYTLAGDQFGAEAIDTLLARMENDRGKFMVIAAGYPGQMDGFLRSNPGLPSRFSSPIAFESYTAHDLVRIAESMARAKNEQFDAEAVGVLAARLRSAEGSGAFLQRDWGNARAVRNIVDEAGRVRNARLYAEIGAAPTRDELVTIIAADVEHACDVAGLVDAAPVTEAAS